MPTKEQVCLELGSERDACGTDEQLRSRFLEAFPIGTQESELQGIADRLFGGRTPVPKLTGLDGTGNLRLSLPYEVQGFAVCKESVIAIFHIENYLLQDIGIESGQTCL
jgi:hypothetical protein